MEGHGRARTKLSLRAPSELRSRGATDAIALLRDGDEAYPAWLDAIASAKREILLEMYWFADDEAGRRFEAALVERVNHGIAVYVLYDAVGSYGSSALHERLATAGARVIEYHPIAPWRRRFRWGDLFSRDHRKLLVVDGVIGFTGGINLCNQAAPRSWGGDGWRDNAVRVTGPSVVEMRALFFDVWDRALGKTGRELVRARKMRELRDASREEKTRALTVTDRSVQVFGHAAWLAHRTIRNLYLRQIRGARQRVWLANAYFVPDGLVRRALESASQRGVDVRVIVPERSDVPSVSHASRAMFGRLLAKGVNIHLWTAGMLHTKAALIDDWATVGSYNFDYRSLVSNLEITVASRQPTFVRSLEASFEADLARTRQVDQRMWAERRWTLRAREWIFYRLRKLL